MRKFIVSDLHGDGAIYDSIINYLENLYNEGEEITLYINGDLIDKGPDTVRMFMDVKDRIENKKSFNIVYLGGNHELMMYQIGILKDPIYMKTTKWYKENGGEDTVKNFNDAVPKEHMDEILNFISNLKIYHKFEEKINGKNIVLVHAKCPEEVHDICNLRIKDDSDLVDDLVWTRREHYDDMIGNKDYFTIIGHDPLINRYGYLYFKDQNYMDIDGGCANYVCGDDRYDHVALVEIMDNSLRILTFNNNNEITFGHNFEITTFNNEVEGRSTSIEQSALAEDRNRLVKPKTKKMPNIRIVS